MPLRSKVEALPEDVRAELDGKLVRSGFSGYVALSQWLEVQGFEISKSSLHAYGSRFEERIATLKRSTDQARAIVAESPDDEGAMSEALMRLVQDKIFTILLDLEVDPEKVNLSSLTKSIAQLGRASITLKKYSTEVRARAKTVADAVERIAKSSGLSADSMAQIRADILGIAKQ